MTFNVVSFGFKTKASRRRRILEFLCIRSIRVYEIIVVIILICEITGLVVDWGRLFDFL